MEYTVLFEDGCPTDGWTNEEDGKFVGEKSQKENNKGNFDAVHQLQKDHRQRYRLRYGAIATAMERTDLQRKISADSTEGASKPPFKRGHIRRSSYESAQIQFNHRPALLGSKKAFSLNRLNLFGRRSLRFLGEGFLE
ncbi:unnamed protein product [Enterobius vermicularis]|uniref:Uncharacterized protein n=1 Tax=Enterobius vermicularis TaxID=51028 RepID=A0A0N4VI43_ENTVE|nr:unnamed protein product [Enterobius vermicularis]